MYLRLTFLIVTEEFLRVFELLRCLRKITFCVSDFSHIAECFTVSLFSRCVRIIFCNFQQDQSFSYVFFRKPVITHVRINKTSLTQRPALGHTVTTLLREPQCLLVEF